MSFQIFHIEKINVRVDRETGEQTKRAIIKEIIPPTHVLNLSNVASEQIDQLTNFVGQKVMLSVEAWATNGRHGYTLTPAQPVIPVTPEMLTSFLSTASIPVETLEKPANKKMFGS